jgi:hypothetical protein
MIMAQVQMAFKANAWSISIGGIVIGLYPIPHSGSWAWRQQGVGRLEHCSDLLCHPHVEHTL